MMSNARSSRIRKLALSVRWAVLAIIIAMTAIDAYSMARGTYAWTMSSALGLNVYAHPSRDFAADPRIVLWLELVPQVVLLYGFARLVQMMRLCERGEIFSLRLAAHLRAFSAALLIVELLDITSSLQLAAIDVALGRKVSTLELTLTGEQAWSLLIATLFLVFAEIFREGVRLAEDSASIV